jgi:hypothetical protein
MSASVGLDWRPVQLGTFGHVADAYHDVDHGDTIKTDHLAISQASNATRQATHLFKVNITSRVSVDVFDRQSIVGTIGVRSKCQKSFGTESSHVLLT